MLSVLKNGGDYVKGAQGQYQEFICDAVTDIAALPDGRAGGAMLRPCPGSTAYIIETGETYILTNTRAWVKRKERS